MISHAWRAGLAGPERSEVAELLTACAGADAEAGFSRPELGDDVGGHLLVWLLPDQRWGGGEPGVRRLAAYLRVCDGQGAYVVHPEFRSRGITTLLVEEGALDGAAFTIWARNDHPAAVRLAARFGVAVARREWQLLAPLPAADAGRPRSAELRPARPADVAGLWGAGAPPPDTEVLVAPDGAVWFDPAAPERTEYGPAGRIHAVRGGPVRALLAAAMAALRGAGLGVGIMTVPSTEREIVHEARALGFRHDQTDVQYLVK